MPQCSNSVDNQTVDAICVMLDIARNSHKAPVPKRPISANPGEKTLLCFCIYLPMHYQE